MPREGLTATARVSFVRFSQIFWEMFTCTYEAFHCPEFSKHLKLNSTTRCHFTKRCELSSVFLYLLSSLPEVERKGGLLKHGAEEFKPGFAMPALISSPWEVIWKNKGCILPVCRAHQEAKAKGFFSYWRKLDWGLCLRHGEMGSCLPEHPHFPRGYYSSTDQEHVFGSLPLPSWE